jgi:ADP-ribosyl-[dinitrogen reductase] hydrolase
MNFQVPLDEDGPATGDVAARGVPIGLLHASGTFRPELLREDAELVTRLTHGSPAAIAGTAAVAYGVQLAARGETPAEDWADATADFLGAGELSERLRLVNELLQSDVQPERAFEELGTDDSTPASVASAFYASTVGSTFQESVFLAVNAGGATDTRGAIAGALFGTAVGANGIPQRLIDGLESRIYVSLAAPWFHKAALRRAGAVIDLRQTTDE